MLLNPLLVLLISSINDSGAGPASKTLAPDMTFTDEPLWPIAVLAVSDSGAGPASIAVVVLPGSKEVEGIALEVCSSLAFLSSIIILKMIFHHINLRRRSDLQS